MVNLLQLIPALRSVGADEKHISLAINELRLLLAELDNIEVKGRQDVDTMLGCMMAIEAIIGKEVEGNS